ncbi:MAG: hypothetical protein AAGI38_21075 [Bacteroidota bacterium]
MKQLYVLMLILLAACNPQHSQAEALKADNQHLRAKISVLEGQAKAAKASNSQVTLANTSIEELTSTYNNQKYQLKIWYPKSYAQQTNNRYPVLYVIDAETNFGGH